MIKGRAINLANEKTRLVYGNSRSHGSEDFNMYPDELDDECSQYNVDELDEDDLALVGTNSYENARANQQRCFIGFLLLMIMSLIGLSCIAVMREHSSSSPTSSSLSSRNESTNNEVINDDEEEGPGNLDPAVSEEIVPLSPEESLSFLNSLYHEKPAMESGCESTLLLIRHCEKNEDNVVFQGGTKFCSWLGRERSYFLPSLFDPDDPQQRRWPIPTKVFALTMERETEPNYREIETVMPLAKKFNLTIDVYPFDPKQVAGDYFELLQSGKMCGKVTVICWKHLEIPKLAVALGCGPQQGCPEDYPDDTFDEVWQMKYVYDPIGKAAVSQNPMDLSVEFHGPLTLYDPHNDAIPIGTDDDDDDDDDDQVDINTTYSSNLQKLNSLRHRRRSSRRVLKHKRKKWFIYGTKTYQNFDPLQYSLKKGDYPPDGSPSGGKWADEI